MELAVAFVLFALLGVLANRFGHDSRPGLATGERALVTLGPRRSDPATDEILAEELRAASRARATRALAAGGRTASARRDDGGQGMEPRLDLATPALVGAAVRIEEEAFGAVGLHLDAARARDLAAALGEAATVAQAEPGGTWAWSAVERVLGTLGRRELAGLVANTSLVTAGTDHGPDDGSAPDPVCDVLRHLLRDRLVDVLRICAGQPPFWSWVAITTAEQGERSPLAA
ncbi:MAG: hypothetical protein AVDCRST_MAG49-697 [uncultured Thermomicrobiales bacterium]|uniref:Uncharacterized protein n=1 Tax=uncultured Thermomicrobiales bacterium TaxID=1645740 RepID=A0A6J4U317_9BACT|nr:MAG: hypothetical protein AVDCRST_MAG49-697 [uncultured Thermomicrobiales bacterium]